MIHAVNYLKVKNSSSPDLGTLLPELTMSTLEAIDGENKTCDSSGYEAEEAIINAVTTGDSTELTISSSSKLGEGDCSSEESEKVATSSTGGDSARTLCMLVEPETCFESDDFAQGSTNDDRAYKGPESSFFKGFSEEEQDRTTTALKAKLKTLVAFYRDRQKIKPLKVNDGQKMCGIALKKRPRPRDFGKPRVDANDHVKIKVNIDSVKGLSTGIARPRLIQTPRRYLDGEGIQKPIRRQSCNVNQLPLHKDKNVFQIGLLPPRYPKSLENSPSGAMYPGPLPKATSKKIGNKNAFGGFFEISYLLQSGELEQAILQHRLKEMRNNRQQQFLRAASGMKGQLKQNDLENCGNPVMEENLQSAPNFLMQNQDCTASSLHLMTHSKNKKCLPAKSREGIAALNSISYSPLLISTPVVAAHDTVPHLPKSIGLKRVYAMRSSQQDAFQTIRKTRSIPPPIMPKLSVPKRIQRMLKEGEPLLRRPFPKIPILTGKTFKKRAMAAQISLVSRKLTKNSNAPLRKAKETFPPTCHF